jgi:hypothetical protein
MRLGDSQHPGCQLACWIETSVGVAVLGGAEDEQLMGTAVLDRTAAYYGVSAIRVPGVGHAMMARAGGDWEVRPTLHSRLKPQFERNQSLAWSVVLVVRDFLM